MVAYSNLEQELNYLSDYYHVFTHDLKILEDQFKSVLKNEEDTNQSCNNRVDKYIYPVTAAPVTEPVKLDVPSLSKEAKNYNNHEKDSDITETLEEITKNNSSVMNDSSIDSEKPEHTSSFQELNSKKKTMSEIISDIIDILIKEKIEQQELDAHAIEEFSIDSTQNVLKENFFDVEREVRKELQKQIGPLKKIFEEDLEKKSAILVDKIKYKLSRSQKSLLKDLESKSSNFLKNKINDISKELASKKEELFNEINSVVSEVKKVIEKLEKTKDGVEEKIQTIIASLQSEVSKIIDEVEGKINKIKTTIENGLENIEKKMKEIVSNIEKTTENVSKETKKLFSELESIFEKLLEVLQEIVNEIKIFSGSVIKNIIKFFKDPIGYPCQTLYEKTGISCKLTSLIILCNIYYIILNFTPPGKMACDVINEMAKKNVCLYIFLSLSFFTTLWFYLPPKLNFIQMIIEYVLEQQKKRVKLIFDS